MLLCLASSLLYNKNILLLLIIAKCPPFSPALQNDPTGIEPKLGIGLKEKT